MPGVIAVLGGTGPEGFGLALRWVRAGETVIIGSRDAARAREHRTTEQGERCLLHRRPSHHGSPAPRQPQVLG